MADELEVVLARMAKSIPASATRGKYDYAALYTKICKLNRPVTVTECKQLTNAPYNYIRGWMERRLVSVVDAKKLISKGVGNNVAFLKLGTGTYLPIQTLAAVMKPKSGK